MQDYILIVEDDNDINRMLGELLALDGYQVKQAFSGTEGLLYIREEAPTAVILDLMLPGMPGEEVLARIKEESPRTAVIVASAKGDTGSRISLLRAGADDFIVKPFDTEELLARLEAVLRRRGGAEAAPDGREDEKSVLTFRDITIYPDDFAVLVGGERLSLTKREYLILKLLVGNPTKVFTKNNIYQSVWNEEFLGEDNAVNVHISNIRSKLSKIRPGVNYIQTVWGIGFKMQQ